MAVRLADSAGSLWHVYRVTTCGHAEGGQVAGWGLTAWHAAGSARDESSSWAAAHADEAWQCAGTQHRTSTEHG